MFEETTGDVEVRGTFPVWGADGHAVDEFQVQIKVPVNDPRRLPITRETGGRIPWTMDRHIEENGTACVLLPDQRWQVYPVGARFLDYLRGPLHSFFLSQVAFEIDGKWPFGEWGHGADGILQHYRELLGTTSLGTITRFVDVLRRRKLDLSRECPCGSGKRTAACCRAKVLDLRDKINRLTAHSTYEYLTRRRSTFADESRLHTSWRVRALTGHAGGDTGLPSAMH